VLTGLDRLLKNGTMENCVEFESMVDLASLWWAWHLALVESYVKSCQSDFFKIISICFKLHCAIIDLRQTL